MRIQPLYHTCSVMHLYDVQLDNVLRYSKEEVENWIKSLIKSDRYGKRSTDVKQVIYFTNANFIQRLKLRRLGFKIHSSFKGNNDTCYITTYDVDWRN